MRHAIPDANRVRTTPMAVLAMLALAGVTVAVTPMAAEAGSEFDDGFEDQLGRLVANEVFHAGKWVLAGAAHHAPARYAHVDRHGARGHHRARHGHAHGHHYAERRHHWKHPRKYHRKQHRRYWRQHHGHDHSYGESCRIETRERVKRNRHGEVIEYKRREVRYPDHYAWHR